MYEGTSTSKPEHVDGRTCNGVMSDWYMQYKRAMDFDLWGQPVEATSSYSRLSLKMQHECLPDASLFTDEQKKVINKIATCLEMRAKELQVPGKLEYITLQDLKELEYSIEHIDKMSSKDFPIKVQTLRNPYLNQRSNLASSSPLTSADSQHSLPADEFLDERLLGNLLPPPDLQPAQTLLTVRIENIGLKDPAQYIDSYITVSVIDSQGCEVPPSQDTPVMANKDGNCVIFGVDIHLQHSLEQLPSDFAVFFEFKHFKPKKKMISTKCWAFMEKDEIKDGPVALELYKKPTNYKRKKLNLLTVKPLYLHVKLALHTFGT